jgi:hypothetical protein
MLRNQRCDNALPAQGFRIPGGRGGGERVSVVIVERDIVICCQEEN